jgi:glycosyltransferase involved in cell wall biosynthesis
VRIAFVYDAIYPYIKGGGERRYYELAKRLGSQHEIHLLGMKFWSGDDTVETEDRVFLHGVCSPMELYVRGRRSIRQAIVFAIKLIVPLFRKPRFDLVECPSAPFFDIFTCKSYSVVKRCPLVVVWLEYWGDFWYEYLGRLGGCGRLVERVAAKLPDHIIAISEHTREALLENGVDAAKISTIPLGIALEEIESVEPSPLRSELIFVGRLIREKKVDILLDVVKELHSRGLAVRCFIVGDGPERTSLEQKSMDLGLENNVSFRGFLERHEDVYALMKSSRVFVFPSTREGFGLVVPEANGCGLPAVVVRDKHSAASSLVQHGESGFVCDLDVQEIADVVQMLLTDRALYASMHASARAWAQQFAWDLTAERTAQAYARLVADQ